MVDKLVQFYIPTHNSDGEAIVKSVCNYKRVDARKQTHNNGVTGLTGTNKSDYLFGMIILFLMMRISQHPNNEKNQKYQHYIYEIQQLLSDIRIAEKSLYSTNEYSETEISTLLNRILTKSKMISTWCIEANIFEYEENNNQ